jgi:octanoyl-[GcvH]:protein N-octanoyltransferase
VNQGFLPAQFHIADTTEACLQGDALLPFAVDEVLCQNVGEGAMPLVWLWRHEKAFILGLRDRLLPRAPEAVVQLEREGFQVGVRHSGGAAVPLDSGVVNISLILPKRPGETQHRAHFETMYRIVAETLGAFGLRVDRGEIAGSYCPGDYDLSVAGRKFCGIAQRRKIRALAVQAFVVAEGSGSLRAERVREFYRTAAAGAADQPAAGIARAAIAGYPEVVPESVTSLKEAGGIGLADFTAALKAHLAAQGGIPVSWEDIMPDPCKVRETAAELRDAYGIGKRGEAAPGAEMSLREKRRNLP